MRAMKKATTKTTTKAQKLFFQADEGHKKNEKVTSKNETSNESKEQYGAIFLPMFLH